VSRHPAIEFWGPRDFLLQEIVNGEEEVSTAVMLDILFGRRPRLDPSMSQAITSNDPSLVF
jgi:hypothetical protein